jgi:hypothetical protein
VTRKLSKIFVRFSAASFSYIYRTYFDDWTQHNGASFWYIIIYSQICNWSPKGSSISKKKINNQRLFYGHYNQKNIKANPLN